MLTDPDILIADFSAAADQLGIDGWPCRLHGELLPAPHRHTGLRSGFGAVYAFALSTRATSAAGAGMVLKVGKVKNASAWSTSLTGMVMTWIW
jgi:hypothetical protein